MSTIVKKVKKIQIYYKFNKLRKDILKNKKVLTITDKSESKQFIRNNLDPIKMNIKGESNQNDSIKERKFLIIDRKLDMVFNIRKRFYFENIFKVKLGVLSLNPNNIIKEKDVLPSALKENMNQIEIISKENKGESSLLHEKKLNIEDITRIVKLQLNIRNLLIRLKKKSKLKYLVNYYLLNGISTARTFKKMMQLLKKTKESALIIQRYFRFKQNYFKNKIMLTALHQIKKLFIIKKETQLSIKDVKDWKKIENNVNVLCVVAKLIRKQIWNKLQVKLEEKLVLKRLKDLINEYKCYYILNDLKVVLVSKGKK